jgi:predicted GNAT family acetyltransferase
MEDTLVNNRSMSRYELPISDDAAAVVYYSVEDGRVILRHTEVPFEFSGQGYGTRLARAVFGKLRSKRARVIATCPFMARFAAHNPQYAAMLDG